MRIIKEFIRGLNNADNIIKGSYDKVSDGQVVEHRVNNPLLQEIKQNKVSEKHLRWFYSVLHKSEELDKKRRYGYSVNNIDEIYNDDSTSKLIVENSDYNNKLNTKLSFFVNPNEEYVDSLTCNATAINESDVFYNGEKPIFKYPVLNDGEFQLCLYSTDLHIKYANNKYYFAFMLSIDGFEMVNDTNNINKIKNIRRIQTDKMIFDKITSRYISDFKIYDVVFHKIVDVNNKIYIQFVENTDGLY